MKKLIYFLLSLTVFVSCNLSETKKKLEEEDKKKRLATIEQLNKEYNESFKLGKPDEGKAASLLRNYLDYSEKYPEDSLSPDFLFKTAQLAISLRRFDEGVKYLQKFRTLYKDHPLDPMVLFTLGFTYENHLNDLGKAEKYYQEFLNKYPNHELANDVDLMIQNLGKSPEEIINRANQNNSVQ
ncbi:MAG: hypothetical protein KatS3mg034_0630 [Vicingaceae bacterium]|nr:MAG: hypothetical protein KatS3mg034_0630 [Vicingaceae bacterium]